jgi:ureidoglycolate lyase
MKIKPQPLTRDAFAPYGEVIEFSDQAQQRSINYGHTVKYANLADIDVTAENGKPHINLFRTKPLPRPISIKVMERHPLSSQAFYPLGDQPYLVVVAKANFTLKISRFFWLRRDRVSITAKEHGIITAFL